jgi:hypothetical protein
MGQNVRRERVCYISHILSSSIVQKKAAGVIRYLRFSSCVLAKNTPSITSVSQRVPLSEHCPDYGAYGALHRERLSVLCGFSEEVSSDTLS